MSPKKSDPQSVIADPDWLPDHWDQATRTLRFVRLPRERQGEFTFLIDEYLRPADLESVSVPLAELQNAAPPGSSPAHFVFHSAFCCSTLLARALDAPGAAMALKEPQILQELADAARTRSLTPEVFGVVLNLLGRPFGPGERVVVKPTNIVNLLAPALLNAHAESRAVFLYAPLPRFLASVASKGLFGRRWARRNYALLQGDTRLQFGFGDAEQFELTDLQIAALGWLVHQAQAAAWLQHFPDRVRTLDSETFLAHRAQSLEAVGRHFQLDFGSDRADEIADGPVFGTHSKELGREFDPDRPPSRQSLGIIDEEIDMVVTWTRRVAEHVGAPMEFRREAQLLPG